MKTAPIRPDNTVTRAEFAKMLYSAVGIKNNIEDTENPFTDVTSAWYYEPVMSLYQDGIINGTSDTTFGPNENLTREQMVTLVTRAADVYDCFDLTVDKTKQLSDFSDTEQISDYATESFIYAYQTGIIAGDDGKLFPKDQSTRAQVVTVIDRCVTAEKILPTKIAQEDWVDAKEYIDLSTGLRMAYVEMGQAEGEPLILLHGHTDSSRTWSMTAQELAKDYHIYILDQRGSGDTEAPDSRAYTGVQFANDVAAFMDAVGLDKAHIVGHSMGSHIAQYLAALYPEKVDRLVLMGSAHVDADASYRDSAEMYADPDFDPSDPEFLDYWDFVTPGIWDGKEFKTDAEEMLEYIKNDTAVIDRKAFVNPPMGSTVCGMTNIYDLVEAPTLLLCGESDAPNQNDLAAELKNYAGMIVYAGHGHSIQWENPYETGKDIAKFLKGEENDKMIQQWQKDLPNKISQEDWNESKQYVQLSTGIVMAYVELGDPQGEPVIMIHGFGGDTSRTFSLMAPYMAENGYHCYLIDRKGNGDSSQTGDCQL